MKKILWYLPFIALHFVPKAIYNEEISRPHYIATAIVQGIYFGLTMHLIVIALMI